MKYVEDRPHYDKPEVAAHRLMELARAVEPVQDGRIHIEKINYPFFFQDKAKPAEYGVGSSWRSSAAGSGCTRAARM
ncbi:MULTISPECIES: hypothetical protein [unclassified Bradyrhizobium]